MWSVSNMYYRQYNRGGTTETLKLLFIYNFIWVQITQKSLIYIFFIDIINSL